ncbi:asparagine synthase (glutamine-hydrolyzing) [Acidomonas methanolica]|uniref:asparagine synthase (glutamine-hydrolyzing) n=1 Tax=Acidomonas methanolica TaxID=437 RepID=UPI00211A5FE8|nr:asparagine synthase (glutamine-hydrolyzing) [Acidomonas methanolica]MCQ9154544.1 asparagine synthase (glutamine-hydrolyzing) [Acidomonas methanolica]
MCGIAGIACRPGHRPDPERLRLMSLALRHRGPDGAGEFDGDHVALRHRRLSIIDIAGGAQPLALGPVVLVANGEIYNDPALRARFPELVFRTGSDCETPLALWPREGLQYADSLRGMYAIALTDRNDEAGTVLLSRDPFGIKPLYIAEDDTGLAFASEPRALLAGGYGMRAIRPAARDALLSLQFTPGNDTIYPGIRRLAPGGTLRIERGEIVASHRLDALPAPSGTVHDEIHDEREALIRLDRALLDSVAAHERADVPFGLFLSGGIDSTVILAAMRKLGAQNPLAWTARFDAGEADESAEAARLACLAGAEHRVLTVRREEVFRHLPEIVAALDDPVADYAVIPTWFLARAARGSVKVILSGEGGDELFGGYGRYRRVTKPWWRGGRAPWRSGALDGCGMAIGGEWRAAMRLPPSGGTALSRAQALDVAEWLPNDLLLKLDRCLMVHAIEGRTPFLDPAVAAVAAALPDALKLRNGQGKYLLRRWLDTEMPEARAFAPKQGFSVPVGTWLGEEAARLAPLVAASAGIAPVAGRRQVERVFAKAGHRGGRAAWHLLFYALWHKIHIEGVASHGDLFDTLAA